MKITYFQQVPYRHLPPDFEQHHEAAVTTPYHPLTRPDLVHRAFGDALGEIMHAARSGFDAVAVTEHGQSSYDMAPNPDLLMAAAAHATEVEGLATGIYPMGRSLGKSREPLRVAEELAMLDAISGGRLIAGFPVGLAYDANINNGVVPAETRLRFDENLELVLKAWQARENFAWNGRFHQYPLVNLWPRPLQEPHPPVFVTGIGNPRTMEFCLRRGFGFNYFGWFGARVTGRRVFDRFWDAARRLGKDENPYRMGFMQTICVADTDAKAEKLYAEHAEYFFRKAIGSIPMQRLALPGGIDIKGLEFLFRDPGDFGIYEKMRQASFADLVEAGSVICGSPATVRDRITGFARDFRIGNLHAMLQFGSMPTELARDNISLFAEQVMPALRGVWADQDWPHHWWPQRLGGTPGPAAEDTGTTHAKAVHAR
ncbi:LLM class flavin-dependent oxidoreductase [Streptomyces aidingensis]|uniref:Flavin-dependent oxidoreductase, luciferase family (Includes alkanesulfonate monooxygenase SsuD and methylene tetrahydromethanopterin reductase) n=1 Tax=Streptomyces aidingensis TaxID=910347 RepID=A0A1I1H633_9ACTN|nr:LLM class flavin-dependent oxidoreductase [Streptomyces aidingensis]SFC19467.1 Flavin-dependent oxidoreductase, luciferase family (includes alkanesulfonate monooxygenase SsuD and methylene tetrahydromethanopterin reductase) [Streptomyces aidingensis]